LALGAHAKKAFCPKVGHTPIKINHCKDKLKYSIRLPSNAAKEGTKLKITYALPQLNV
jgi:hypothetical protein